MILAGDDDDDAGEVVVAVAFWPPFRETLSARKTCPDLLERNSIGDK